MADATLAIHGGPRAFAEGPFQWPLRDDGVYAALEAAWLDGSWGLYEGPHSQALGIALRKLHELPFASLCCSGTVAVELALRGVGVTAGDEVVLAGYDYPGNFRSIEAVGAVPVLTDIGSGSWCLAPDRLENAISSSTRAIVVSHLHGSLADAEAICQLAASRGVAVIEDACQVPGAIVQHRLAGCWGVASALSFGGSKLLTAGRGGAVLTADERVHQRIKVFSERGNQAFPLSELQAAVLLPQLEQLSDRNRTRRENARYLVDALRDIPQLRPISTIAGNEPVYYKLGWLLESERISLEDLIVALRAEGVPIDAGFPGFVRRGSRRCRRAGDLPNSEIASARTLLLHHPVLLSSRDTLDRLAGAIRKVMVALA